jgi:hypothetical protein
MSEELVLVDGENDIELVVYDEPTVEVVTEGIQGPPGPAGKDAQQYRAIALFPMSGHRAVVFAQTGELQYADAKDPTHIGRVVGITLNAANPGFEVSIALHGDVEEPSWSWEPNKPVWVGSNGVLTQVEPSVENGDAFSQVIGFAWTPTKVFLRVQPPLSLA